MNDSASLQLRAASALFEFEARVPVRKSRAVLKTSCALFAFLIAWSLVARLDMTSIAHGRLVPETYVKIVQPAEAGIVRQILVTEGDAVAEGQVLVRLDPTALNADRVALERELGLQRLQLRRIAAELSEGELAEEVGDDGALFRLVEAQLVSRRQAFVDAVASEQMAGARARHELAAAAQTLGKLEASLSGYEKSAAAYEKLANERLMPALQAEDKRREAMERVRDIEVQRDIVASLEAALEERTQRLALISSSNRRDLNAARVQALSAVNGLEQELAKNAYREALLDLRAPEPGVVKDLATTTLGAVVQPGTVLLSLVPVDEPLLAEIAVENRDIGFVSPGQSVRLKLATYPFQKYGMVDGVVRTISADAQSPGTAVRPDDRTQAPSFRALVELKTQRLEQNGVGLTLTAGMDVSAEITQGTRTVLEYLLSPVQRIAREAGRER